MKNFLKSKSFRWLATVFLFFLLVSFGQKLYQRHLIEQEISTLKDEIAALGQGNKEILDLISYFKTPEFKERQARSLLSLQKPGEFAVALPPREDVNLDGGPNEEKPEGSSNLLKWWDYFFASRAK